MTIVQAFMVLGLDFKAAERAVGVRVNWHAKTTNEAPPPDKPLAAWAAWKTSNVIPAYRKAIMRHHPDHPGADEARARRIIEARVVIEAHQLRVDTDGVDVWIVFQG